MSLRVVLADDHQIVRQGCRALLERDGIDVVAEASDGWEAVKAVREHNPDVVVLDVSMPRLNGLDAAREILASARKPGVVLLTMRIDECHVAAALQAGVRGYVVKTQAAEALTEAIREVAGGGTYLTPKAAEVVVGAFLSGTVIPADPLTPRERQVLQLVAEGRTTREVAAQLNLGVKTAESYRARLMEKLDIHETAGLVRYAIRHGMIDP
jgi:DNA-binding NarL/FixJ family response regulator